MDPFAAKSRQLQAILRSHGFAKGDGVNAAGCRFVSSAARKHHIRDWPDTKTLRDYDLLIAAVLHEINISILTQPVR